MSSELVPVVPAPSVGPATMEKFKAVVADMFDSTAVKLVANCPSDKNFEPTVNIAADTAFDAFPVSSPLCPSSMEAPLVSTLPHLDRDASPARGPQDSSALVLVSTPVRVSHEPSTPPVEHSGDTSTRVSHEPLSLPDPHSGDTTTCLSHEPSSV